ncbi:MAG: tetratricopeptide repeat protein [Hyphomicrobiales bacterium]
MYKDWLGNEVTAASDATVAGIDDFLQGYLGYEVKAVAIFATADNDADCAIANAYAAICNMFLEAPNAPALARRYIERAEAAAPKASRRERLATKAVRAWVDGDIPATIRISGELAREFPRELAIAKTCQYHLFNLGDSPGMLRIAKTVYDANIDLPYMHGMIAFAYEQCHFLEEAEQSARHAIALKRKEPWAHHALAHVLLTQGRIREGVEFLEDVKETWTDLNSFMFTHNWWHLCLYYISLGAYDEVLSIYDRHVWGMWKEYSQDQIGAVSLLMRLELVGVDVGDRWRDVGHYLRARAGDVVQPFLSMQYLYGLARAGGREADALMAAIRDHAAQAPAHVRESWREVALPACEGLLAHARGDYETCVRKLGAASPRLLETGGSHAQRDLFDQVLLDATIRSGRLVAAQRMLELRRQWEPHGVPLNTSLAAVYQGLGLTQEAARAAERAKLGRLG